LTTQVESVPRMTWVRCNSLSIWQPKKKYTHNSVSKTSHVPRLRQKPFHKDTSRVTMDVGSICVNFNKTWGRLYTYWELSLDVFSSWDSRNYLLLDLISHVDHLRSSVVTKLSLFSKYKIIKILLEGLNWNAKECRSNGVDCSNVLVCDVSFKPSMQS